MRHTLLLVSALLRFALVMAQPNAQSTSANTVPGAASAFRKPIKNIGILLYDGYTTLDAMGPYQVLGELMGTNVFFVAKKKGAVHTAKGLTVVVDRSFADTDSLDILLIPGGFSETYQTAKDPETLNWIRKIDRTTVYTTSVCTGAWILAATGLLNGRNATTHWYGKPMLAELGARPQNERWVRDGKYWTSAGVTAGMDMCLALINDIRGEQYTKAAMLDLEYDPQPPFRAGSEQNTEKPIVDMMREMYDAGLASAKKLPAPTTPQSVTGQPKAIKKAPVKAVRKTVAVGKPVKLAPTGLLVEGTDPVCQMTVSRGTLPVIMYGGRQYGFCSELCQARFRKNPAQYATK